MKTLLPIALSALFLTSCSGGGQSGDAGGAVREAAAPTAKDAPAQMAYSYAYRFTVPEDAIAAAQSRHVAMCDRLGVPRCRVLEVHRSTGEYGGASLKLAVASDQARAFGASLAAPVAKLGGSLASSDVEAEDVGRQVVDATARLRAKEALVARLQQALEKRPGSTADLVTTEKAIADAQGELEAVRAELALVQGRVDASPMLINYQQAASFSGEVGDAFGSIGSTLTWSVVALIYFLAGAIPWAIAAAAIFLGVRAALRWRRRRRP